MDEFKNSKSALIGDVDCTAEGKDLCDKVGVKGYPTIKYGDPSALDKMEDYAGARDLAAMKKFAEENLGPLCGPKSLDVCDDVDKAHVEAAMAKSVSDLDAEISNHLESSRPKHKKFQAKQRKFEERYLDFSEELREHTLDKMSHAKVKAKFESDAKDKAKFEKEKAKFAKQDKKMQGLIAKFDKRNAAMEAERAVLVKEETDLNDAIKASGIKLKAMVREMKSKNEL